MDSAWCIFSRCCPPASSTPSRLPPCRYAPHAFDFEPQLFVSACLPVQHLVVLVPGIVPFTTEQGRTEQAPLKTKQSRNICSHVRSSGTVTPRTSVPGTVPATSGSVFGSSRTDSSSHVANSTVWEAVCRCLGGWCWSGKHSCAACIRSGRRSSA